MLDDTECKNEVPAHPLAALAFGERRPVRWEDIPADARPYVTEALAEIATECDRLHGGLGCEPDPPEFTVRHGAGFAVYTVIAKPWRATVTTCNDAVRVAVRLVSRSSTPRGEHMRGDWRECAL